MNDAVQSCTCFVRRNGFHGLKFDKKKSCFESEIVHSTINYLFLCLALSGRFLLHLYQKNRKVRGFFPLLIWQDGGGRSFLLIFHAFSAQLATYEIKIPWLHYQIFQILVKLKPLNPQQLTLWQFSASAGFQMMMMCVIVLVPGTSGIYMYWLLCLQSHIHMLLRF